MYDEENGGVRNTDPETSHEAAAGVDAAKLRLMIYELLVAAPDGLTVNEMEHCLRHVHPTSLSPRIVEMERRGMAYRRGDTRTSSRNHEQLVVRPLDPPFVPSDVKHRMTAREKVLHETIKINEARIAELESEIAFLKLPPSERPFPSWFPHLKNLQKEAQS